MTIARILAAALLAGTATTADAKTVVVTAAHMIDVLAGKRVDNPQVTIVDGRITAVGRKGDAVPTGAERVDLGERTLLPGLIDMHVHLTSDPTLSGYRTLEFTDNFWTVVGVANARKTLDAGFTTVRNVGSANYDDVALKQGIERGYVPGPRIVPATYALGATGGHCDATEFPPSIQVPHPQIANTPDEFRGAVRTIRKYGAEVVKVCMTGGVLSKTDSVGAQQISLPEIKAIVDEAHMLGMKVAVHAHGTEGINDALRAGVDTIEHASLADAESFKLAKASGAWFDMDIYDDDYILAEGAKNGVFAESLEKERAIGLKQRQTFRAAHAAGVKMLFGTDGGVYPNGNNALQFAKMVEWGMTPLEAIQAATSSAATALGRAADVGAIQPGRFGDLIAVEGDPLADVRQLEHPAFVMKGGAVVVAAH
ncbi:Pro-Hyp dipeptidase [Sphingomonas sp. PP-F2F-G114-C0414]|uniref:Xaa-Pro dipeptidase n=1 Tax=Sphingomonas sp. PP-F2F-G114-C0414 TaxID=2135662 RepID=UPI000F12FB78|nr:amidohydrolase family protein [Sphingomonas sp. PP-F2F-G114-C0414]RMB28433.1 Pro-Hyp dipeptidase [Sphingomonas sp. PP-F2F-G114-C0414]